MKLKEKLAEEVAEAYIYAKLGPVHKAMFIAGFEKCGEMAAREFKESRWKYSGYEFSQAFNLIHSDLLDIGEEEV